LRIVPLVVLVVALDMKVSEFGGEKVDELDPVHLTIRIS